MIFFIQKVCSDVPVTGSQCDGLDLENCQEVPVNKLKCRQVSSIECQALRDRGGDCRYAGVEGDKRERGPKIEASWRPVAAPGGLSEGDKPVTAGGMQAFKICEDFPEGEVCREVEMEVCHASKDAEEERLCQEVEVYAHNTQINTGINGENEVHVFSNPDEQVPDRYGG